MSSNNLTSFEKLYAEQNYQKALDWLEAQKNDFDAPIYYYNKGTLLYKQNKFSAARYHFEKAKKEGLYTSDLFKNLESTRSQLKVIAYERPQYFLDYWHQYGSSVSVVFLWIGFFLVASFSLFLKIRKKITLIPMIFICLLVVSPLALKYFYFNTFHYVIAPDNLPVYEGASKIFPQSSHVPAGAKVLLKKSDHSWEKIISPVKASGWVEKKAFNSLTID